MFDSPLLDKLVGLAQSLVNGLVPVVSLPEQAFNVENADHRCTDLISAKLDPSLALTPPCEVGILLVENLVYGCAFGRVVTSRTPVLFTAEVAAGPSAGTDHPGEF